MDKLYRQYLNPPIVVEEDVFAAGVLLAFITSCCVSSSLHNFSAAPAVW
jgi:hypothetical protein